MKNKVLTNNNKIFCIGDSHVSFFSGEDKIQPLWPEPPKSLFPFFQVYRLGAVLAYNLCKNGTKMQGREKLFTILAREIQRNSKVLLCFGEIDCRAHLLRQSKIQKKNVEEVTADCVERYFNVIIEVKKMGYDVLLWNVIPSSMYDKVCNPEYPVYGSCIERNYVTKLFNSILGKKSAENGIQFISIFDELVDGKGLTRMEFYKDEVHLSQKAMPLTLNKISTLVKDIKFSIPLILKIKYSLSTKQFFY